MKVLDQKNGREGQAMILATLALGGTILGATAIAGFLMLYQIRQSTDFEASAKALFAADAGTEWALYTYFNPPAGAPVTFSDPRIQVQVTCYDSTGTTKVSCDNTSTAASAVSQGSDLETKRAFGIGFDGATSSLP